MERTAFYAFFAERYHWTYAQTMAENPDWYLSRLPAVAAIFDEVRDESRR
jgi:hypothetical protein